MSDLNNLPVDPSLNRKIIITMGVLARTFTATIKK